MRLARPRLALYLLCLLAIPLLVVAERALHSSLSRTLYATGDAAWIWAPLSGIDGKPIAFFVSRDFRLDALPRSARLVAAADENMRLTLNGRTVAADSYSAGEPPGVWEVGDALVVGRNRLTVTLTSARGVGAFIASLAIEAEDGSLVTLRTGPEWSVFWRYRKALADPSLEVDEGARPHVWGVPPIGRWPGSRATRELPTVYDIVKPPQVAPRAVSAWVVDGWKDDERAAESGGEILFDWGREVTGYLTLISRDEDPPVSAVYYGVGIPDPVRRGPQAIMMAPAGGRLWQDTVPRTFRYALVVGIAGLRRASVLEVDRASAAPLVADGERARGVLGLEPPRLRTPVENEIWGELESLESSRAREVR